MAKKTAQADPESATTQVNIADFQRTRDSVCTQALIQVASHLPIVHPPAAASPPWPLPTPLPHASTTPLPWHRPSCRVSNACPRHQDASSQPLLGPAPNLDDMNNATLNLIDLYSSHPKSIARIISHIDPDGDSLAHFHDQVIVALATLQSSVSDLSRAYIQHANTVLAPGKHGLTPIDANLTSILTESGLLAASGAAAAPAEAEVDGKKKRKRTPHDPNAPKRALTPYFLYMQSARATIAKELGDSAKPKEVADEGTRRWTEMSPAEKSVCCYMYCSVTQLLTTLCRSGMTSTKRTWRPIVSRWRRTKLGNRFQVMTKLPNLSKLARLLTISPDLMPKLRQRMSRLPLNHPTSRRPNQSRNPAHQNPSAARPRTRHPVSQHQDLRPSPRRRRPRRVRRIPHQHQPQPPRPTRLRESRKSEG